MHTHLPCPLPSTVRCESGNCFWLDLTFCLFWRDSLGFGFWLGKDCWPCLVVCEVVLSRFMFLLGFQALYCVGGFLLCSILERL
ncbi:hypothetical protein BDE02_10G114800 [Populus trichocarpa]|nr:hypothetical protein BDE02_10G114800 [Populus trichocarpa]